MLDPEGHKYTYLEYYLRTLDAGLGSYSIVGGGMRYGLRLIRSTAPIPPLPAPGHCAAHAYFTYLAAGIVSTSTEGPA